ncbi:MAG: 50S ribosomal protein L30 [Bifidobacteriaceae bacterium]|jgi:large subunit ribosomal protein L30|nr:50S ribosomal protein L30 [Bifidobacteriaceae bacterium]
MAKQLKVTQVKSKIGRIQKQHDNLRSLGLKKIHQTVVVEDNPITRGYINKVSHLVTVEEVK